MSKRSKKHTILGGVKVDSEQLSEWGSLGGRPKKYANTAEKSREQRLRKKQEKLGEKAQLRGYKSYGEEKIKRFITCPYCRTVNNDLRQYFTKEGELIKETYWWSPEKGKHNIHENIYHCFKCSYAFSFLTGEIEVGKIKEVIPRAGSGTERSRRSRGKDRANMTTRLTWEEYQRIKDIKTLDLEICDFGHVNILNLGWEAGSLGEVVL